MKTPVLETNRLILRPMTAADAEAAFANWASDPEVSRFMRWETHKSVEETIAWLASEEELLESGQIYDWGLVLKETGELIGSGGLVYQESKGMYELGYNLMKKYWGLGLAIEAAQRMIDFGRNELRQKQFFGCHAKDNIASGRVLSKIGFQYQGDGVYYSWDQKRRFDAREYYLTME